MKDSHNHNQECLDRIMQNYNALKKAFKDRVVLEVHRVPIEEAVRYSMLKQNILNMKEKEYVVNVELGVEESTNELGFDILTSEKHYDIPYQQIAQDIIHRDGIAGFIDMWNDEWCFIIFCFNDAHSGCGRSFEESLKINFS